MCWAPRGQVTQRADKPPAALHYSSPAAQQDGQVSWRDRLRALFCCFAPDASEQYYRGGEGEAAVIRPPQPPTPPAYRGEPVIGSLQARPGTLHQSARRPAAPLVPRSPRRPHTGRSRSLAACSRAPAALAWILVTMQGGYRFSVARKAPLLGPVEELLLCGTKWGKTGIRLDIPACMRTAGWQGSSREVFCRRRLTW